jgi:TusE/DsrC/DsvC family sulfur relay protein
MHDRRPLGESTPEMLRHVARLWGYTVRIESVDQDGFFSQNGTAPNLRFLQKGLKEEFGAEWGEKKFLFDLFPFGPAKQAGRYAGTPKPTGCV